MKYIEAATSRTSTAERAWPAGSAAATSWSSSATPPPQKWLHDLLVQPYMVLWLTTARWSPGPPCAMRHRQECIVKTKIELACLSQTMYLLQEGCNYMRLFLYAWLFLLIQACLIPSLDLQNISVNLSICLRTTIFGDYAVKKHPQKLYVIS
jgi:hypothetical protein